jgi:hypothetical protein
MQAKERVTWTPAPPAVSTIQDPPTWPMRVTAVQIDKGGGFQDFTGEVAYDLGNECVFVFTDDVNAYTWRIQMQPDFHQDPRGGGTPTADGTIEAVYGDTATVMLDDGRRVSVHTRDLTPI